jgi:hypothetical protein
MVGCPEMAEVTVVDGDGATGRIAGELPHVGVAACAGSGGGARRWRGAGLLCRWRARGMGRVGVAARGLRRCSGVAGRGARGARGRWRRTRRAEARGRRAGAAARVDVRESGEGEVSGKLFSLLCRVPAMWHSAKIFLKLKYLLCRVPRIWLFAECQQIGTRQRLRCRVSTDRHSIKSLFRVF